MRSLWTALLAGVFIVVVPSGSLGEGPSPLNAALGTGVTAETLKDVRTLFGAQNLRRAQNGPDAYAGPIAHGADAVPLDPVTVGSVTDHRSLRPFAAELSELDRMARPSLHMDGLRGGTLSALDDHRPASSVAGADLRTVLAGASLRAPILGAARADVDAADAAIREAWGAYIPRVEASLGYEAYGRGRNGIDTPREVVGGLSLSYGLFDAARGWRLTAARHRHGAARWSASATRDQLFLDIMSAWVQTVSARKTAEAFQGTANAMSRLRYAVVAREREGYASKADIARLDADIAALRQEVVLARLEASTQGATLSSLAGRPIQPKSYPDVSRFLSRGKTWLAQRAQRGNAALNAATAESQAIAADATAARNSLLPGVDLTGRYDHAFNNALPNASPSSYSVGVRVSMPIFAVTERAQARRLKSEAQASLWRVQDRRRQVGLEIETLWAAHEAYRTSVELAADAVALNRRVLVSLEAQYAEGLADLGEVLERQRLLVDAEFALRKAVLEKTSAAIRIVATAGLSNELLASH